MALHRRQGAVYFAFVVLCLLICNNAVPLINAQPATNIMVTSNLYFGSRCSGTPTASSTVPNNECVKTDGNTDSYVKISCAAVNGAYQTKYYSDSKCTTLTSTQNGQSGVCETALGISVEVLCSTGTATTTTTTPPPAPGSTTPQSGQTTIAPGPTTTPSPINLVVTTNIFTGKSCSGSPDVSNTVGNGECVKTQGNTNDYSKTTCTAVNGTYTTKFYSDSKCTALTTTQQPQQSGICDTFFGISTQVLCTNGYPTSSAHSLATNSIPIILPMILIIRRFFPRF